jgi:hypothetical protein
MYKACHNPALLAPLPDLQVLHWGRLLDTYHRQAGSGLCKMAVYARDSDVVMGVASLQAQLGGSPLCIVYRTKDPKKGKLEYNAG